MLRHLWFTRLTSPEVTSWWRHQFYYTCAAGLRFVSTRYTWPRKDDGDWLTPMFRFPRLPTWLLTTASRAGAPVRLSICHWLRSWWTIFLQYCRTDASLGTHHKNLNEDRPILSAEMWVNDSSFWKYKIICKYSKSFLGELLSNRSGMVDCCNQRICSFPIAMSSYQ